MRYIEDIKGFTLVELMVAITIFGIASGAIYATYQYQQDVYLAQEQVAEMQQNGRAGIYVLGREIKMAGYDPSEKADAGIVTAGPAELVFTADRDGSGALQDSNSEQIRFALSNDADKNGIADSALCELGEEFNGAGGLQDVVENVDALEFFYHLADGTATLTPASPADIRSIDVSLLVKTGKKMKGYRNQDLYFPASNPTHDTSEGNAVWGPYNDHHQRRLLIAQIKCRNMGID